MQQARVLPVTKQLQYLDCVWMIEIVLLQNSGPIFQLLSLQLNLINFSLKSFVTNNHKDKFSKENEKYSQEECEEALVLAFRRARFESFPPPPSFRPPCDIYISYTVEINLLQGLQ